ncbi:uncharacterized protein J4E79_009974 [Alternaria viburni]|uniref:uncharacterized protein n=1 Tax=Alternaria viburni TaxID=566460 RepID=UPI0020C561E7|nr:uncharacterized protein J4E79_009974 [Alternaria viburni]KAI4648352.1 hypothetical protein J4E79_009974 [Alternaria viburni]
MYFTDVGVEYICDKDRGSEAAKNLAATLRDPTLEPGLAYMERMMHEYTGRRLTYDHDALNAIVGALDTQAEDDHIWGVHLVKDDIATESLDLFVYAFWDAKDKPVLRRKQGSVKLPCAVIIRRAERHYRLRHPTPFEEEIQILILRQHDTHYERIGYFAWNSFLLDTYSSDEEPWDSDQSSAGSSSFDPYYEPEETTFALDKQGNEVYVSMGEDDDEGFRRYGDGRYWLKDGVETTFLLG